MDLDLSNFQSSIFEESIGKEHKIDCGGRVLYVNGQFLAEQSPYFAKLFFGSFKESATKTLNITQDNIQPNDIVEYLSILYGRKEIEARNFAKMIALSDIWETPSVKEKCRLFLKSGNLRGLKHLELCIDILEAAISYGLRESTMDVIDSIIISFSRGDLEAANFFERINDTRICYFIGQGHGKAQVPGKSK